MDKIIEENKAIAEFMQVHDFVKYGFDDKGHSYLTYHKSWNALIPVVEKVKSTHLKEPIFGTGIIGILTRVDNALVQCNIEATWLAVVEFIKWHNQIKHNE